MCIYIYIYISFESVVRVEWRVMASTLFYPTAGWQRLVGCLIFADHLGPIIRGSCAERDLQLLHLRHRQAPCVLRHAIPLNSHHRLHLTDECCSVSQCVAVCCSVLQCVAVCCSVLQCVALCCSVLQCSAVYCSVL